MNPAATDVESADRQERCASDNAFEAAEATGLRYVTDALPGIRRKRQGKHFRYFAPDDTILRDEAELARIQQLHIPPAWKGVWICPHGQGHLQATGRDDRRRKQYRYHNHWRAVRDGSRWCKPFESPPTAWAILPLFAANAMFIQAL